MAFVSSIGDYALSGIDGKIVLGGSFPLLSSIGTGAFADVYSTGNVNSKIELVDGLLPKLVHIGDEAFRSFKGTLTVSGGFPLLDSIGELAFKFAGNVNSKIELVDGKTQKLESIGPDAFNSFPGTITIDGSFPLLYIIRERAFV